MNQAALTAAGIDFSDGIRRLNGDVALYDKLLLLFLEDLSFQNAVSAIEQNHIVPLRASIHELVGISGNLGFTSLYRASRLFLEQLHVQQGAGVIPSFAEVQQAYRIVVNGIQTAREG